MLTVLDTSIIDNDANSGGGIHNEGNGATLSITSSTLKNNTAKFNGGAIINDGPLTVLNTSVIDNEANSGGGIYTEGTTSVTNSTFHGNNARSHDGGGFFNKSGQATIQFSTFTENTADNDQFFAVRVTSTPASGSLQLSGKTVIDGDVINATSIVDGDLIYAPAANDSGITTFSFAVIDDGGTSNNGRNTDSTDNKIQLTVCLLYTSPSPRD